MKKIIILVLLSLNFSMLFAQGGSNFSMIGIGDINYEGNAAYSSLGGTSVAIPSAVSLNYTNPALWSWVKSTRLQAGYYFAQHINSSENITNLQNNASFNNLSALFAIDTAKGISASFGLIPYTRINYMASTNINRVMDDLLIEGKNTYSGDGGISQLYLGTSVKLMDNLSFGVTGIYNFGKVARLYTTEIYENYYYTKYESQIVDYFSGFGYKTGIYYEPIENLGIGAFLENNNDLDIESNRVFQSSYYDSTITNNYFEKIPVRMGLGASYRTGVFMFGTDFSTQDFSNFNYNSTDNVKFNDSWQLNFAVNRIGNESINAVLSDRISYKFGLSIKKLYYSISNEDMMDYSFSLGGLIPFSNTFNSDIAFTIGKRSYNSIHKINEIYTKLNIDISIGETWFVPFKREY